MRTNTALSTILLLTIALFSAPLSAGAPKASELRLRIVDQTRGVLPAAKVTIYTLDGQPSKTVTTDANGVALFKTLPAGAAQVHASFPGFAPYIEATTLKPGRNVQTVTLRLAPVSEQVFVSASPEHAGS
jgi:hypothetical protein